MKLVLSTLSVAVMLAACGPQQIKDAQNVAMGDTNGVKAVLDTPQVNDSITPAVKDTHTVKEEKPAKPEVKQEPKKEENKPASTGRKTVYGKWVLESLNGKKATKKLFPRTIPYINIDGEKHMLSGSGGCNNISGECNIVDGKTLQVDRIIATKMFCEGVPENEFLDVLRSNPTLSLTNDKMTLTKNGTVVAVFFRPYE